MRFHARQVHPHTEKKKIVQRELQQNDHKNLLQLAIISLTIIALYFPTFQMFIYDWSHDDNYSHGFLVPLIVGYLVWTKKEQLRALSQAPRAGECQFLFWG